MSKSQKINIDKIAHLARINLTEEEKAGLNQDLTKILSYVEKLDTLKTDNVDATSHVLNIENVYREDEVNTIGAAANVLDVLPENRKEGSFFKVPKVIEEN